MTWRTHLMAFIAQLIQSHNPFIPSPHSKNMKVVFFLSSILIKKTQQNTTLVPKFVRFIEICDLLSVQMEAFLHNLTTWWKKIYIFTCVYT